MINLTDTSIRTEIKTNKQTVNKIKVSYKQDNTFITTYRDKVYKRTVVCIN